MRLPDSPRHRVHASGISPNAPNPSLQECETVTARVDRPWRPRRSKGVWTAAVAALALGVLVAEARGKRRIAFRDALRRFNRRWFNPLVLRLAGHAPWPVARLEHRGRRTGAFRATPVLAWPVAGGFVVLMPYGPDVDWAKNLHHSGEGVLQYQGVRYRVGNPRIVPARDASDDLPWPIRLLASPSGMRHTMRLDVLASLEPEVSLPA